MTEPTPTPGWPLRLVVILGLICLVPAMVNFGIATFVGKPRTPTYPSAELAQIPKGDRDARTKIQDEHRAKQAEFRTESAIYAQKAFWISLPFGILALGAGLSRRLGDVGTGFVGAGLVIMGMSHISYYSGIADEERFISFAVGVVLLLAIAWRRIYSRT